MIRTVCSALAVAGFALGLPAAPPASADPCGGTISPGVTEECPGGSLAGTFGAVAGQRARVRTVFLGGAGFTVKIFRPDGALQCSGSTSTGSAGTLTCTLSQTGTHQLQVSGSGAPLYVNLRLFSPPVACAAFVLGSTASGSISLAADTDCSTFTGSAGNVMRIRRLATSGALSPATEVVRPEGFFACFPTSGVQQDCALPVSSGPHPYSLLVYDAFGPQTGTYRVHMQRLSAPEGCSSSTFGSTVAGAVDPAPEADCFTFAAAAGDRVRTRLRATTGGLVPRMELRDPSGALVCGSLALQQDCAPLASPGAHTLYVFDEAGPATGAYSLWAQRLNSPDGCTPVAFGTATPATIGGAAEADCFTFGGATGDAARVRVTSPAGLHAEVRRPGGDAECDVGAEGTCTLQATGTHTIYVDSPSGQTGPFTLSLLCLTQSCDAVPPETTITSGPSGPVNTTSVSFAFSSSEIESSFECALDSPAFSPCASPAGFTLPEGPHAFRVRARDPAGNADPTPDERAFTIDTTAPDTIIDSGPQGPLASRSAVFTFHATEPGASFQCSLDSAPFAPCAPPAAYDGLNEGPHTFQARARDPAGNLDPTPAARSWLVDTLAPELRITRPREGTVYVRGGAELEPGAGPAVVVALTESFELAADAADAGSGVAAVRFAVDGLTLCGDAVEPYTCAWTPSPGPHVIDVEAQDAAGNVSAARVEAIAA